MSKPVNSEVSHSQLIFFEINVDKPKWPTEVLLFKILNGKNDMLQKESLRKLASVLKTSTINI